MPKCFMLIGLPCSGKSSFIKEFLKYPETKILSTDDAIENYARAFGKTYDEVFEEAIKGAETNLNDRLETAIAYDIDIIWDQTNMTAKSRARKLARLPEHYQKIGIVFTFDLKDFKTISDRLNSRPGKTVPKHVIWSMMETFQMPTLAEGFNFIYEVKV